MVSIFWSYVYIYPLSCKQLISNWYCSLQLRDAAQCCYYWAAHSSPGSDVSRSDCLLAIWESSVAMARLLDIPMELVWCCLYFKCPNFRLKLWHRMVIHFFVLISIQKNQFTLNETLHHLIYVIFKTGRWSFVCRSCQFSGWDKFWPFCIRYSRNQVHDSACFNHAGVQRCV